MSGKQAKKQRKIDAMQAAMTEQMQHQRLTKLFTATLVARMINFNLLRNEAYYD